jgi:hypothetical protein
VKRESEKQIGPEIIVYLSKKCFRPKNDVGKSGYLNVNEAVYLKSAGSCHGGAEEKVPSYAPSALYCCRKIMF